LSDDRFITGEPLDLPVGAGKLNRVPAGDRERYEALLADIGREFPGFRIVRKDRSRLHRAIDIALRAITLGGMKHYLDGYHTTLGQTVWVTPTWDGRDYDLRTVTLRHERVHMRQFRRWTWLGMVLLYGLLPLPMGVAYFRARFEQEAYAESIRATAELFGMDRVRDEGYRNDILGQFTGPAYGWMWPFRRSLERWYDSVVATLR
jgi:hypothetical protein